MSPLQVEMGRPLSEMLKVTTDPGTALLREKTGLNTWPGATELELENVKPLELVTDSVLG